MNKIKFKKLYSRIRKIRNSEIGLHGHYSDLVREFNVTMEFIRNIIELREKQKKIVLGKYTKQYQNKLHNEMYWEEYGERLVGA